MPIGETFETPPTVQLHVPISSCAAFHREKYALISENEFLATFKLSPPGKDFAVCRQTRFNWAK